MKFINIEFGNINNIYALFLFNKSKSSYLMKIKSILFLINFIFIITNLCSQDLTRQSPTTKIVYLKGNIGATHYFEPQEIVFTTGKLYKLTIKNVSDSKHYFSSNSFSKAIFTRKIQISSNNYKLAEIKGIINEIEVWPGHEVEWWFVPIKTGKFDDLNCRVKDRKTNLKHSDMGMQGTIIIK